MSARYRRIVGTVHISAVLAFLSLVALHTTAQAQMSREEIELQFREAEALRAGDGVPIDLLKALSLHRELVAEGYNRSYVRLASIYMELERFADAIESYELAVERNESTFARVRLARNNANGAFGPLSDPIKGFEDLKRLAQEDSNESAGIFLAEAYEGGHGTDIDLAQAVAVYQSLADRGNRLAQARLGRAYREGRGVAVDLEKAIAFYSDSAEQGYDTALIGLARAQVASGKGEAAYATIRRAASRDVSGADAYLARWHEEEVFGSLSDPELGRRELVRLAEEGDLNAARVVLQKHERRSRRINEVDLDKVLAALEDAAADGSTSATVTLARAYRRLYWLIPGWRKRHATLVADLGEQLGPRYEVPERLEAAYDPARHGPSRVATYDLLRASEGVPFISGFVRLRAIEQRAFVYALQSELLALGYYRGRVNGLMTGSTLRSVLVFCNDAGIFETCKHGPMNYSAVRLIAKELDARRQVQ